MTPTTYQRNGIWYCQSNPPLITGIGATEKEARDEWERAYAKHLKAVA